MRYCLGLLIILLIPITAYAQERGWANPQKIKTDTQSNWFPSVGVDPWGAVHLVWSSGKGEGEQAEDLLMYSVRLATNWRPANDILRTGVGGWAARNSLAIDRSGRLHLLVRSQDHIYYTSAANTDAWSARGWAKPHIISGVAQPYYSTIAIDEQGILHAVWSELTPRLGDESCETCSDLWYRRSIDQGKTWSAATNLSQGKAGSIKPQIILGDGEEIYVTWDEGKDPNSLEGEAVGIAFSVSRDRGATWTAPERLALADSALEQVALGIDGKHNIVMVFRATTTDALLFRYWDAQTKGWTEIQPFPGLVARSKNDTPWDKYSMAADSAGNVHLLAVARRSADETTPGLYHVTWSGERQEWGNPELVVANTLYPEWPQLVIANGNQLHATWFTRSPSDLHNSDQATYQVWYSERTVSAPLISPQIVPTPTAVPSQPSAPAMSNTVQRPTLPRETLLAPPPVPVKSELPLIRYLALSLAAPTVLLLCALLLALRRFADRHTAR